MTSRHDLAKKPGESSNRHDVQVRTAEAVAVELPIARAINERMLEAWPHLKQQFEGTVDFLLNRWTHYIGPDHQRPIYHLASRDGQLIGLAHTFPRKIVSHEGELIILGLANVCVANSEKGRGCGRALVEAAFARVKRDGFACSLFQTTPEVQPFYERLGAAAVHNRFYNSQADNPDANPFWEKVAMRFPGTGHWPESDIDLLGRGF